MTSSVSVVDGLGEAYEREFPIYKRLAETVAGVLENRRSATGIKGSVSARPKNVESFVKKAIRKGYADPLKDIRDKAGVRIVIVYKDDVAKLRVLIRKAFVVHKEEDKEEELGSTLLGYQGVHFEAALRDEDAPVDDLRGLLCEIQIHTQAQSAWSEVSHELIYKALPKPPVEIERRVMLLQALVEMFDREVENVRTTLMEMAERRAVRVLHFLEPHFSRMAGVAFDEQLSMSVLEIGVRLYGEDDEDTIVAHLTRFIDEKRDKLTDLFRDYREAGAGRNPLLLQPEAILLFERLEQDMFSVMDEWAEHFDLKLLEWLAESWGLTLPSSV